jgi:hypothetical protein
MMRLSGFAFVLISALLLPGLVEAQEGVTVGPSEELESGFRLGSNYPNPFKPDTRIPFELHESMFVEGRPVIVSIRIYDIVAQYVASPTALGHPAGDGTPVVNLEYGTPGRHETYWDGKNSSGSYVVAGVYLVQLTVNGETQNRRVLVSN